MSVASPQHSVSSPLRDHQKDIQNRGSPAPSTGALITPPVCILYLWKYHDRINKMQKLTNGVSIPLLHLQKMVNNIPIALIHRDKIILRQSLHIPKTP